VLVVRLQHENCGDVGNGGIGDLSKLASSWIIDVDVFILASLAPYYFHMTAVFQINLPLGPLLLPYLADNLLRLLKGIFMGRISFLSPNNQCQGSESTNGKTT